MAVGDDGVILRTTDAGANWELPNSGTLNWLMAVHFVDSRNGIVVGQDGIVLTTHDAGLTWEKEFSGSAEWLQDVYLTDAGDAFTAGGVGAILKKNWLEPVFVHDASDKEDNQNLIQEFFLEQNYPNPFNAATMISFTVKHPGQVTLGIYDVQGRLVQMLVQEELHTGFYNRLWQAENVASGVYFLQGQFQQAGSNTQFSESKKLLLLK